MTTPVSRAASSPGCVEDEGAGISRVIARAVGTALLNELHTYPKPGLVSLVDTGAHDDMDHLTMTASIAALVPWFERVAEAGRAGASFDEHLRPLGMAAEQAMVRATNGINAHRGAIFCLGMLAAAAGRCTNSDDVTPRAVQATLLTTWGPALDAHRQRQARARSHGGSVVQRHGVPGAAGEAAAGFPAVFEVGVPAMEQAREDGLDENAVMVQTLFELMAAVPDTNVLHRGGATSEALVQNRARAFVTAGGCHSDGWWERAEQTHAELVALHLSPGGCADLLAASAFVVNFAAIGTDRFTTRSPQET